MSDSIDRTMAIATLVMAKETGSLMCKELKGVIEVLNRMPPAQQWIPCSERLPEHGERYLISVLDGINRRTTVAPYLPRCKTWAMTGRMAYWKVIAWMPLPEPYKEDDHETD